MIESLADLDRALFLYLNGAHHPLVDPLMYVVTYKFAWIPLYLLIIGLLIRAFGREAAYPLAGGGLVIVVTEQIVSGWMKPGFGRSRPCQDPELQQLVHLVTECADSYGFASGHAANTAAVSLFVWLVLRRRFPHVGWLFVWAAAVAYSRVYVGVHYPGDVLAGAAVGAALGAAGYGLVAAAMRLARPQHRAPRGR